MYEEESSTAREGRGREDVGSGNRKLFKEKVILFSLALPCFPNARNPVSRAKPNPHHEIQIITHFEARREGNFRSVAGHYGLKGPSQSGPAPAPHCAIGGVPLGLELAGWDGAENTCKRRTWIPLDQPQIFQSL